MGWMYTTRDGQSIKDFFQSRFGDNMEILDCKVKKLRTAYMAVKVKETGKVFGLVCLLDYRHNDYPYDLGYKDIDEDCGPCERECPESVLKLLTPTDSEYANQWRKDCWENINKRKGSIKVKKGDTVIFDEPIMFDGFGIKRFEVYNTRRNLFRDCGILYRISSWRNKKYKVEKKVKV